MASPLGFIHSKLIRQSTLQPLNPPTTRLPTSTPPHRPTPPRPHLRPFDKPTTVPPAIAAFILAGPARPFYTLLYPRPPALRPRDHQSSSGSRTTSSPTTSRAIPSEGLLTLIYDPAAGVHRYGPAQHHECSCTTSRPAVTRPPSIASTSTPARPQEGRPTRQGEGAGTQDAA